MCPACKAKSLIEGTAAASKVDETPSEEKGKEIDPQVLFQEIKDFTSKCEDMQKKRLIKYCL